MLKKMFLIIIFGLISSCSGSGTTSYSSIAPRISGDEKGKVFVQRESLFVGGGALVTILINGRNVGKLGNGEMLFVDAKPGVNFIEAKVSGVQGVGLNTAKRSFHNGGEENNFFIVTVKSGMLLNTLMLYEISSENWKDRSR